MLQWGMNASKVEYRSCHLGTVNRGGMAHLSRSLRDRNADVGMEFPVVRVSVRRTVKVKSHQDDGLPGPVLIGGLRQLGARVCRA